MEHKGFKNIIVQDCRGVSKVGSDTKLLALVAGKLDFTNSIEIGSGSGFISIYLAKLGRRSEGVDISDSAINCSKKNATLNDLHVKFNKSDLFSRVSGKYDLIIFNPPYGNIRSSFFSKYIEYFKSILPKENEFISKVTYFFIKNQRWRLIDSFLEQVDRYLTSCGRVLMVAHYQDLDGPLKNRFYKIHKYHNDLRIISFSKVEIDTSKYISLIIPAFNEEAIIGKTIDLVFDFLRENYKKFEVIIADDGSEDETPEIVREKKKKLPQLRFVRNQKNSGRGSILTKAFKSGNGDYLIYLDADIPAQLDLINKLTRAMSLGADIAIASKYKNKTSGNHPLSRKIFGNTYSRLISLLFGENIKDYSFGFKGFKREVIRNLIGTVENNGWFWDAEIVLRALRAGYRVKEVSASVTNINERESKLHLLRDSYRMGRDLIFFWIRINLKKDES